MHYKLYKMAQLLQRKFNQNFGKPLLDLDCHVGSFSHASLGSWGVVDQLTQAAFLPDLGLMTMEVGTVSCWRGVPPW